MKLAQIAKTLEGQLSQLKQQNARLDNILYYQDRLDPFDRADVNDDYFREHWVQLKLATMVALNQVRNALKVVQAAYQQAGFDAVPFNGSYHYGECIFQIQGTGLDIAMQMLDQNHGGFGMENAYPELNAALLLAGPLTAIANLSAEELLVSVGIKEDLVTLRVAYVKEVESLADVGKSALAAGESEENVAQMLNQMRRDLGIKYKAMTPPDLLEYISKFNQARYGDELGPTYEYLKTLGKTDLEIIESASRPLGDQKQLGAALLAYFGDSIIPILGKYDMLP